MKKLLTVALSLCLLLVGIVAPAKVNAATDLVPYKITVPGDYFKDGSVKTATLHYGINGWTNVKDAAMTLVSVGYPVTKQYEVTVYVPRYSTLDYAIKYDRGTLGIAWDNNGGKDYHASVGNGNIDTVSYNITISNTYLKAIADYTPANPYDDVYNYKVTLHYGLNGWTYIKDLQMSKVLDTYNGAITNVQYKATITVNKNDVLDFAYYVDRSANGEYSAWYNNGGADWHLTQVNTTGSTTTSRYFYVSCSK